MGFTVCMSTTAAWMPSCSRSRAAPVSYTHLDVYKRQLLDWSVNPIQQYSYTTGKNATDSAMIIDAMDILYSGNVDGFCLVSSDSDFTKLAQRLREAGMFVMGIGEQKTPKPFRAACDTFKLLEIISSDDAPETSVIENQKTITNIEDVYKRQVL